ncbi:tyrosine-type recombinase/integrase [Cryobacterium ruanii]|uniref:tyrosine-type recombinase/integrase n=1 Tax=Cryobacterium ruanii TaxID=1259197 RepID=UPI00141AE1E6|nr:site-specific integrase [Cryobacterium ruanii]
MASILDVAVRDRRVLSNAARGVKLPRKVGEEHIYLSHQQVALLAGQCARNSTMVEFLAYTVLRWGETTALRVKNLDFSRRRVNVHQKAVGVGGAFVLGTPKSHQSRSVPFPGFLSTPLKDLCVGKAASSLVFGTGTSIAFVRPPDSRRGWWMAALKKCQVDDPNFPLITPHDLRHTAASLAISAGANVKAVQGDARAFLRSDDTGYICRPL